MVSVATKDAVSRIGELLHRVEGGEVIAITRDGLEVARLVPVGHAHPAASATFSEMVEKWKTSRNGVRLNGTSVRNLRDEGRP